MALLVPMAPLMAWPCEDGMLAEDDWGDVAPGRCAGLWSAACCYFASPPRPTDSVPGGFDADKTGAIVGLAHLIALLPSALGAPLTLDFALEERAGPPPPRLLTSLLLI